MFFGQEVHHWEKDEDLGDTMRAYERFFEEKYVVADNSGYFSQDEIAPGNHFMRWGCNGIMSGIKGILDRRPGKGHRSYGTIFPSSPLMTVILLMEESTRQSGRFST